jgi:hypothetical protein
VSVFYLTGFGLHKALVLNKSRLEEYESYIDLTVQILQNQNFQLLCFLKDFLTCLPSPSYIEQIFAIAFNKLSLVDFEACSWLANNPSFLMPELDLIEFTKNCTQRQLENHGAILNLDFKFKNKVQLHLNQKAKDILENCTENIILKKYILSRKEPFEVELSIPQKLNQLLIKNLLIMCEL